MWYKCKDGSYINLENAQRLYVEDGVVIAELVDDETPHPLCATTMEEVITNGRK